MSKVRERNVGVRVALIATAGLAVHCSPSVSPPYGGPYPGVDSGTASASPTAPVFSSIVEQPDAPPPVSGGTLKIVTTDSGPIAIVSDPDRDQVYLVNLGSTPALRATIALQPHDEPGRIAVDSAGRVHVVLRRGGAVASIDPTTGALLSRRAVCTTPRGIDFDAASQSLYVACASGELMRLSPESGAATEFAALEPDLRDVVVGDDRIYVTQFRSTAVFVVQRDGTHALGLGPNHHTSIEGRSLGQTFTPTVAWRTIPDGNGGIVMVHQRSLRDQPKPISPVVPSAGYYAGFTPTPAGSGSAGYYGTSSVAANPCGNTVVHSTVSFLGHADARPRAGGEIFGAVVPVDIALSPSGQEVSIVAAGNSRIPNGPQVYSLASSAAQTEACNPDAHALGVTVQGQAVALAYGPDGTLYVQSRGEEAALTVARGQRIVLSRVSREDTGHSVFHSNSGGNIACASCHPEAGDDGHVWIFTGEGIRRTQDLRGTGTVGLLSTAPFHWAGEEASLGQLMTDIFVGRMSGVQLSTAHVSALGRWIDRTPSVPSPSRDAEARARGRALFESADVGCASCHSGPMLTNNQTVDVGTGEALQVPTLLGLHARAPYMHDGCATTLAARFTPEVDSSLGRPCGGGDQHGHTSQLASAQINDLIAYIDSL